MERGASGVDGEERGRQRLYPPKTPTPARGKSGVVSHLPFSVRGCRCPPGLGDCHRSGAASPPPGTATSGPALGGLRAAPGGGPWRGPRARPLARFGALTTGAQRWLLGQGGKAGGHGWARAKREVWGAPGHFVIRCCESYRRTIKSQKRPLRSPSPTTPVHY